MAGRYPTGKEFMGNPISPMNNAVTYGMLRTSWGSYRQVMVLPDGRPIAEPDTQDFDLDGNIEEFLTFSEAVAYVMLRAVLIDDYDTFIKVWGWAKNNLLRNSPTINVFGCQEKTASLCKGQWQKKPMPPQYNNYLPAWRYTPSVNGGDSPGGIIDFQPANRLEKDRSGINAASDDLEIAVALGLAALRNWTALSEKDDFQAEARLFLTTAWDNYVIRVGDEYYLSAGDQFSWAGELNPSYFRPAFFSLFSQLDPDHPWSRLNGSAYEIIEKSGSHSFDGQPGVNLPPNWLRFNYDGDLAESRFFKKDGSDFGWDAFRTFYAVSMDYAWFNNPAAERYLTGQTGPLNFLQKKMGTSGWLPGVMSHNGNSKGGEVLAFYGGYLPFLHYAGDTQRRDQIIERLRANFNKAGYWSGGPRNYYEQNWLWFGLFLTNGLPEAQDLLKQLPPYVPERTKEPVESGSVPDTLFQIDPRLGQRTPDHRPQLNREALVDNLSFEQLQAVVNIMSAYPYSPLSSAPDRFAQFRQIRAIDEQFDYKLLGYFSEPGTYWNNTAALLSVYAQKLVEADRKEELPAAVAALNQLRLAALERKEFAPNDYNEVLLKLTEAELRARAADQSDDFYRAGIATAAEAIEQMQQIDPETASPDYYVIAKGLIAIGDLHLQLDANANQACSAEKERSYSSHVDLDIANYYFQSVANLGVNRVEINLSPAAPLIVRPEDLSASLLANELKGHLTAEGLSKARTAIQHLRGTALAKSASLYLRNNNKNAAALFDELEKIERALQLINASAKEADDFFLVFAMTTKADLLISLADLIKYGVRLKEPAGTDLLDRGAALLALNFKTVQPIDRCFELNEQVYKLAGDLYRQTPSKYSYLFSTALTKLAEISIRRADFINREFNLLSPFYTNRELQNHPVPAGEFTSIETDYIKSLLLISSGSKTDITEARRLLGQVLANCYQLERPYQLYFELQARLKLAETLSRGKKYADAAKAFAEIEKSLADIEPYQKQLTWQPYSFQAELYHEWAVALLSQGDDGLANILARKAIDNCFLSDAPYDSRRRSVEIATDFLIYDYYNQQLKQFGGGG